MHVTYILNDSRLRQPAVNEQARACRLYSACRKHSIELYTAASSVSCAQALLQAMREEQLDTLKRIADGVQQVRQNVLTCLAGVGCCSESG